jgi:hypothetical protein
MIGDILLLIGDILFNGNSRFEISVGSELIYIYISWLRYVAEPSLILYLSSSSIIQCLLD